MPLVIVDEREYRSTVVRHIKLSGCSASAGRLDVGDYVVSSELAFERKSARDFVASIVDGRLFDQARRLREAYARPVFVVEGDVDLAVRGRMVSRNAVIGAQLALIRMGISILYTSNEEETGTAICLAAKQEERSGKGMRLARSKGSSLEDAQLALLASLPGIGPRRAQAVLEAFSTPMNALVNFKRWGVAGVPETTIEKVERVLTSPYNRKRNGDKARHV